MRSKRSCDAGCRAHVPGDVRCEVEHMEQEYAQCQVCGREICRSLDAKMSRWRLNTGEPLLFATHTNEV